MVFFCLEKITNTLKYKYSRIQLLGRVIYLINLSSLNKKNAFFYFKIVLKFALKRFFFLLLYENKPIDAVSKMKKLIPIFFIIALSGCAIFVDEFQSNQRQVLEYLLADLPLPKDADIIKDPTVILGTGDSISGRVVLVSGYTPAENLIFYGNETPSTGWALVSSKVGEEITLVYTKEGRYATIDISPKTNFESFIEGSYGSDVMISMVHPDAIAVQNPLQGLGIR